MGSLILKLDGLEHRTDSKGKVLRGKLYFICSRWGGVGFFCGRRGKVVFILGILQSKHF